jgi:hypothetical protein
MEAEGTGSMDVSRAQTTKPVRLQKFLTKEEIDTIHAVAARHAHQLGKEVRSPAKVAGSRRAQSQFAHR